MERKRWPLTWIDFLFLVLLVSLALLPPINEWHKQATLLAIGVFQLVESRLIAWLPNRGPVYSVLIKILLSTLLIDHTGEVGINSSYYPIYYLPVITAAIYYELLGTIAWTVLASLAYCSLLIPALQEYEITRQGYAFLATRILFFFLAGLVINRFVSENKKQVRRYQTVAEELTKTNQDLKKAQANARRAERLAALGQLSAGLAHEVRNPLGIIRGSAEMLARKLDAAKPLETELAGNIISEVNRLNALVARFLDFARPAHLDPQAVEIAPILDRAVEAARQRYPQEQVAIEHAYEAKLPRIMGDEQLCEQVFVNLIMNAYEAMMETANRNRPSATPTAADPPSDLDALSSHDRQHDRPKKLRISAARADLNGQAAVAVEVEDSGPGIAPEL
jgi:two-component system, NtrC family, sensor histidine kinase HydH